MHSEQCHCICGSVFHLIILTFKGLKLTECKHCAWRGRSSPNRQLLTWKCVCLNLTQQLSEGKHLGSCIFHVAWGINKWKPSLLFSSLLPWTGVQLNPFVLLLLCPEWHWNLSTLLGHRTAPKIDSQSELTVATQAPDNIKTFCLAWWDRWTSPCSQRWLVLNPSP